VASPIQTQSTKLVPLDSIPSEGYVVRPEFWAQVDGEAVFVTAVLERTVVYVSGSERKLTNRKNCFADPRDLVVRPVTSAWGGRAPSLLTAFGPDADPDLAQEPSELPMSAWPD
jgi:hypothetical protein